MEKDLTGLRVLHFKIRKLPYIICVEYRFVFLGLLIDLKSSRLEKLNGSSKFLIRNNSRILGVPRG